MKLNLPQKLLSCLLFFFFQVHAYSQTNKISLLADYENLPQTLTPFLKKGSIASFKKEKAADILRLKPASINFSFQFENREWEIVLEKAALFSNGFSVTTGTNPNQQFNYTQNLVHYKGKILGKPNSFAAITILADQLIAVIADENGNINMGAINTAEAKLNNDQVIYRDVDLLIPAIFNCNVPDAATPTSNPIPVFRTSDITAATVNAEPIDIYFEADYTTYLNNGSSVTNTVNYVTALFNVVHTLFENDSINTKISGIKVWNTTDPYVAFSTSGSVLSAFSSNMAAGFPGDLAHFLSQRSLGGGVAYLNVLCSNNSSKVAVSGNLTNSFNAFPVYSWSSMVITHETGHNIGSPHTQSCSWPGGAIDNCYATEGGCAAGPAPVNGGTMMSYCHLTGNGINFSNGFGMLPGALIRNRVRNNNCIYPGIYFETTLQNVSEESADVQNGCLDYKLLTTKVTIPYSPSQPADITFLPTGNAGLQLGTNEDVEITPLSFTLDSAHTTQLVTMKVYNDAYVENQETLTLNFDVNANGGNAVKRNFSTTYNLNISSNDHSPDSLGNQLFYYEPFDSIPTGLGNWTQTVLYGAASPNRWIISNISDADFSGKAAYISNNADSNSYSGSSLSDSAIVRIESPTIDASAYRNISLGYLYKCVGESTYGGGTGGQGGISQTVVNDFGSIYFSINNGASWILLKDKILDRSRIAVESVLLPAIANNSSALKIAFQWQNNASLVKNPPFVLDSIVMKGATTTPIQTLPHPGNTLAAYIGPNQTVHFYNPVTQNIMATIENNSSFDFGCTTVELKRTGNGAASAWDNTATTRISEKAYVITPTNVNTSAPYKLTLYFTKEEIAGWLAETGNVYTDIQIVKSDSDLTQTVIPTALVFSSVNFLSDYGVAPNTIVSGLFTGFSSFAIMKAVSAAKCPGSIITYGTGILGSNYQWQVNTGAGYTNISNTGFYAGSSTDTLQLILPPTSCYGYKYRCAITTVDGVVYSPETKLQFAATWQGAVSNEWEDATNWGCGIVPDENVDVTVEAGATFYPEVNANAIIRSLKASANSTIIIKPGVKLVIKN